MEQEKTVNIKDLNLSNFEKFILALVKSYPKGKRQKELAYIAGIYESEISRWRAKPKKRGEDYTKFFEKYIDKNEFIKTHKLKLIIHRDLADRLIEIAKKDERAKEIISKSRYFEDIVSKDLKLLIAALNECFLDYEKAGEIFLKVLNANGISKEEILKKLNISEKAFSVYLKLFFKSLAEIDESNSFDYNDSTLLKFKDLIIRKFISMYIGTGMGRLIPDIYDAPPSPSLGNREEVKDFLRWVAQNIDWKVFLGLDILRHYLLSLRGEKWVIDRWINLGCIYILLKYKLDLIEFIKNGKSDFVIRMDTTSSFVLRLAEKKCPLDGKYCNLELKQSISCEKIKKIYELGDFETYREEVIEK